MRCNCQMSFSRSFERAEFQVAVPQKTDGQDKENGQADGQRGEYDALED